MVLFADLEEKIFPTGGKYGMIAKRQKKGGHKMKGFSVCGLVLGIIASLCGACAIVFSALGLRRR